MADRLLYPVEAWRQWYADVTTGAPELSPADVLARWEATAAPSYQILGFPPSAADRAEAPLHTYLLRDGTWWIRDPDATSMVPRPGISWDAAGPFLRTPDGRIVRSRDQVAEHFAPIADDDLIAALIGGFPTARKPGSQKPSGARVIARALVCLSLRDGGMPNLTAVRTWLAWEREMGRVRRMPGIASPCRSAHAPTRRTDGASRITFDTSMRTTAPSGRSSA